MLQRVMDEIRAAGVITHDQLQRKLASSAARWMTCLALLKRKGYIQDSPCGQLAAPIAAAVGLARLQSKAIFRRSNPEILIGPMLKRVRLATRPLYINASLLFYNSCTSVKRSPGELK
jgi:hypothetical protein